MKVTRQNVFETNSSSTHSITIVGEGTKPYRRDRIPLAEDGVCRVYPGEFGWEVCLYHDAATKASYALTWAYAQQPDAVYLDLLRDVIVGKMGVPVEFMKTHNDYYPTGYIDHQSADVCKEAFESKERLRDFIFNSESKLRTDNDNH